MPNGQVTKVELKGFVQGRNGTARVIDWLINSSTDITEHASGTASVASGTTETIPLTGISSAKILVVETDRSCTLTFADTQKVNVDGLYGGQINSSKSVNEIVVVQTRNEGTAIVNWFAAQ